VNTTLDGEYKFAVSEGAKFYKPPEYVCPTHGLSTDGCITFWREGKAEGTYCMECYKDMIRKFCQPVTPA
jgi:hypothetical protein